MQVSRKVDYALRAVIYLSARPEGHFIRIDVLSGRVEIDGFACVLRQSRNAKD